MTFHIKKLGVKIGIALLEGLIALKKGLTFLLFLLFAPFRFLGRFFWILGGRALVLSVARIAHTSYIRQLPMTRPLLLIFFLLIAFTAMYKILGTGATSSSGTHKANEVIVQAPTNQEPPSAIIATTVITTPPSAPDGEEDLVPLSTIAGGNALFAPSINITRIENRLREEPEEYIVQEGDTLSDIAARFGISIETILWENKLSLRSLLKPGMSLTILPVSGISHIVRRGETIGTIARRYKVEEREILEFNEIADTTIIAVGNKLIIPEGAPPAVPRPVTPRPVGPTLPPPPVLVSGKGMIVPATYRRISQWFTYRHSGIDMAGPRGTPIHAALDGVVVFSGWARGYGYSILIDHGNGLATRYAHDAKNFVTKGERVERGQTIALMGSTGRSTGPHVHFETIVNGRFVNPLRYIKL